MVEKLWLLIPEMILFAGVVVLSIIGLSRSRSVRDLLPAITCLFLAAAFVTTPFIYEAQDRVEQAGLLMPGLGRFVKMVVCLVGILLTMLSVGIVDRRMENDVHAGRMAFDPLRTGRGVRWTNIRRN